MSTWYVYIVVCKDETFYTGVTTDIARRVAEHNGERGTTLGAKYTKVRRPVRLWYSEVATSRSQAQQRESVLRKLSRAAKIRLTESVST